MRKAGGIGYCSRWGCGSGGCRNQLVPLQERHTVSQSTISKDTLVELDRLRFRHRFDTLPLNVPVFVQDSTEQVQLRLTRDPTGVAADVNVRRNPVLVPRVSETRTDTVVIERTLSNPRANHSWWQRLWPGLLLGGLLVLGLRLLLK